MYRRLLGPDTRRRAIRLALRAFLTSLSVASSAHAFTITLAAAAPKTVYFQVGVGTFTRTYCRRNCRTPPITQRRTAAPGTNTTVNQVSVSVPASAIGNGSAQGMTTDSTQGQSFFDNYAFCNLPTQLYIGGYYRTTCNGGNTAIVTATVPTSLTNAAGNTIPFSQISWTSGGIADAGAEPFPAGSFTGTSVGVGSIAENQWAESCWTFSYANSVIPAAGTFTGRVTYTITAP